MPKRTKSYGALYPIGCPSFLPVHSLDAALAQTSNWSGNRSSSKVYGIEWASGREAYTVYTSFNNTSEQRMEMLMTESVRGIQECQIGK